MELDFDKNYISITTTLMLNRSHPYIKRDIKWILTFIVMQGIFTSVFVLLMYNIFQHNLKINDFSQTCSNGVLAVMYLVTSFEYLTLLWHQDAIVAIINDIKRDYKETAKMNTYEKEVMYKYIKIGQWVCKQWVVVGISGNTVFIVKSIILMCYYYWIDDFKLVEMYNLIYPNLIENNKDKVPVFLMTYAWVLLFGVFGASIYTGFAPLGTIFILHACAQLDLVKKRIEDIFLVNDNEEVRKKLKFIIERIQYIDSYVDRVKDVFKICYEMTFKGTTIMLPIACYQIVEALRRGEIKIEFVTFIIGAVLIISAPCYYSDLLMEKGEAVRLAIYSCGWEKQYDRRMRTTLQLMLQHALSPIAIQSVFTTVCLDTLTDLFQQSYALFNLMCAAWD